jgi:hypothetical protein
VADAGQRAAQDAVTLGTPSLARANEQASANETENVQDSDCADAHLGARFFAVHAEDADVAARAVPEAMTRLGTATDITETNIATSGNAQENQGDCADHTGRMHALQRPRDDADADADNGNKDDGGDENGNQDDNGDEGDGGNDTGNKGDNGNDNGNEDANGNGDDNGNDNGNEDDNGNKDSGNDWAKTNPPHGFRRPRGGRSRRPWWQRGDWQRWDHEQYPRPGKVAAWKPKAT